MIKRLAKYLDAQKQAGYQVIGTEVPFKFEHGSAKVSGTVDRIERNAEGKVVIVDLKTGAKIDAEAAKSHPQLGLYQLAFEKKAFGDLIQDGDVLEGARLVFISSDSSVVDQVSITSEGAQFDVAYFTNLLEDSAREMSMEQKLFVANLGSHCTSDKYGACSLQLVSAVSHVD